MKVKVGSFTTGTLNPGGTLSITGIGFKPIAILFMLADPGSSGSTDVDARGTSVRWGFGFSANLEDRGIGVHHTDPDPNKYECIIYNDRSVVHHYVPSGAERMYVQSYDSDGFTLKTTTSWSQSIVVAYMALAGDGVEADLHGNIGGIVGEHDSTPFSFDPDLLISFMNSIYQISGNLRGLNAIVGVADSLGDYVAGSFADNDAGNNSFGDNYIFSGEMWAARGTAGRDRLVNFITNGYRHEVLEALAGWGEVHVMGIKTGGVKTGDFLTQTSIGQFSVTGIGFKPVGLMLVSLSIPESTQDTVDVGDAKMVMGFTDGTAQRCTGYTADHGVNPPRSTCFYQKDGVYFNNGTVAAGFLGIAEFVSFDSDGFTLDMTDADPTASFVWYVALGPEGAAIPGRVQILR